MERTKILLQDAKAHSEVEIILRKYRAANRWGNINNLNWEYVWSHGARTKVSLRASDGKWGYLVPLSVVPPAVRGVLHRRGPIDINVDTTSFVTATIMTPLGEHNVDFDNET